MLRQIFIFHNGDQIFVYNYALAFGNEEFSNLQQVIQTYIDMPMPGKTFRHPIGDYQVFHRGLITTYFVVVADLNDTIEYMDDILIRIIDTFKALFPNPISIKESNPNSSEFQRFLVQIQKDLHSKIAIVGPLNSGRTTLYNMLKSGIEKEIMNYAITTPLNIDNLWFDLWHFTLEDNSSPLWGKFLAGADLVILIFDASSFVEKRVDYFINLIKSEGKLSKKLIIANKMDLVNEEDISKIKTDLEIQVLNILNLTDPEASIKVLQLIREPLNLKKQLPSNFKSLMKEAEELASEKNVSTAIVKYNELIQICNDYHEFSLLNTLQQKLQSLEHIKEKQSVVEKEKIRKKKYTAPNQVKFSNKISVKSLPKVKTLPSQAKPATPVKPVEPVEKNIPSQSAKKAGLKPVDLSQTIKFRTTKPVIKKTVDVSQYISDGQHEKALQKLIENEGSSLSIELCEQYISEIKACLPNININIDCLKIAAEKFASKEREQ